MQFLFVGYAHIHTYYTYVTCKDVMGLLLLSSHYNLTCEKAIVDHQSMTGEMNLNEILAIACDIIGCRIVIEWC